MSLLPFLLAGFYQFWWNPWETALRTLHRLFDSEQSLDGKVESAEKEITW